MKSQAVILCPCANCFCFLLFPNFLLLILCQSVDGLKSTKCAGGETVSIYHMATEDELSKNLSMTTFHMFLGVAFGTNFKPKKI